MRQLGAWTTVKYLSPLLLSVVLLFAGCRHVRSHIYMTAFPSNGPYCLLCGSEGNLGTIDTLGRPGLCPSVLNGDPASWYVYVKEPFQRLQFEGVYTSAEGAHGACHRWYEERKRKHEKDKDEEDDPEVASNYKGE